MQVGIWISLIVLLIYVKVAGYITWCWPLVLFPLWIPVIFLILVSSLLGMYALITFSWDG